MNKSFDELFEQEEFKNIDTELKKRFKLLAGRIEGKDFNECIDILAEFIRDMPKGKTFSKEEKNAMLSAIMANLDSKEQIKFKTMVNMLEGFM